MKNLTDYIIITGASRGLGCELAYYLAKKGTTLLLIARDKNSLEIVAKKCRSKGAIVFSFSANLATTKSLKSVKDEIVLRAPSNINKAYLFNNASKIEPIKKIVNTDLDSQKQLLTTNLISPFWLTSEFLRFCLKNQPKESYIINMSSGVSLKPIEGWSLYCTSKAGINMLTSCIAEETSMWKNKVYSMAINPGAIDTEMQKTIRSSDVNESAIALKFKNLHEQGSLKSPKAAAKEILDVFKERPFPNGKFIDLNIPR